MIHEDILHLARLARIKISDAEATQFAGEIKDVLGYVGQIDEIVADTGSTKTPGAVHNVFRADEVTNEPESYTEALLAEMPKRHERFLSVPKILNPDS